MRTTLTAGEVAEWSNAPVLKTGECNSSVGSNPTLSAISHEDINIQYWWDEKPRQSTIGFDKKRLCSAWQAQRKP